MKFHLRNSAEPITEHTDTLSDCGATIHKAVFVFTYEGGKGGGSFVFNQLLACRKCMTAAAEPQRYFYGLLPGQESHDQTQESV